jgi:hypothetical protein
MKIFDWLNYTKSWSFIRFLLDGFALTPRSLVRLVSVWFCIAVSVLFGSFLGKHLEKIYGIAGRWTGYIIGILAVFILIWLVLLGRILLFFPFTTCRKQKCHGIKDYGWPIGAIYGRVGWGVYRYGCRCGDEYIRQGRRLMELLPDGTKRPYKKLIGFRKWADDLDSSVKISPL